MTFPSFAGSFVSRLVRLSPRRLLRSLDEIESLHGKVQGLETRVRQLVAAHESTEKTVEQLRRALAAFDPDRIQSHVTGAVAAAPLASEPFPHVLIDKLLPEDAYHQLVKAIPPRVFFEHLDRNHQEVTVPSDLAPLLSREIWAAFYGRAVTEALVPGLVDKFREPLDRLVCRYWPRHQSLVDANIRLELLMSRILLRRPGYVIKPHRDPRWAFLSCLVYLPPRNAKQFFGTQLCSVRREPEHNSHGALWMEDTDVDVVKSVQGDPNTALAFVNGTGAHRASIPDNVASDTERYLYQFQLGPSVASQRRLLASMPEDEVARWRR
jgi:hypothetical protein